MITTVTTIEPDLEIIMEKNKEVEKRLLIS